MKKILMLTSMYPIPGVSMANGTSVCHYFAKEWIKIGYEVVVVYNYNIYMPFFHLLAQLFNKQISNFFPVAINEKRYCKQKYYEIDGIKVLLLPCYKPFPRNPFPARTIRRQVLRIIDWLNSIKFSPDVIVGHVLHPNMEIVSLLKHRYRIPTAIVLHGPLCKYDMETIRNYQPDINMWGFRSYSLKTLFEREMGVCKNAFMCFSGVPSSFISENSYLKMISPAVTNFIYVGNLIKRKHPLAVVDALHAVYHDSSFKLDMIGTGGEDAKLRYLIKKYAIGDRVILHGRLKRDVIKAYLLKAECFIMVSEAETFGLVYLEAMANGCIVVASKNEGMDGIIMNGVNGFLCTAGNVGELIKIISRIRSLSVEEKMRMAKEAITTAMKMTDIIVARKYLEHIIP
jgi:glycosyltransferase involved in cell wall biosynthesis